LQGGEENLDIDPPAGPFHHVFGVLAARTGVVFVLAIEHSDLNVISGSAIAPPITADARPELSVNCLLVRFTWGALFIYNIGVKNNRSEVLALQKIWKIKKCTGQS